MPVVTNRFLRKERAARRHRQRLARLEKAEALRAAAEAEPDPFDRFFGSPQEGPPSPEEPSTKEAAAQTILSFSCKIEAVDVAAQF